VTALKAINPGRSGFGGSCLAGTRAWIRSPCAAGSARDPDVGLLPHLSVIENVALVPRLLNWPAERREVRARELLELVGLPPDHFGARPPAELSGGQRQRVGIARALAADPPLLLMDEPFGALDPLTRHHMQDEFRELQQRLGKTVVLVTHEVAEALRLAHQVAVMDCGRVAQRGSPAEIRDAPEPGFVREFLQAAWMRPGLAERRDELAMGQQVGLHFTLFAVALGLPLGIAMTRRAGLARRWPPCASDPQPGAVRLSDPVRRRRNRRSTGMSRSCLRAALI
jgi:ABC-type taurine transport system ATPase subunit